MNSPSDNNTVGVVTPEVAQFDQPLMLACGRELEKYQLVYETYGEMNEQRSNAVNPGAEKIVKAVKG